MSALRSLKKSRRRFSARAVPGVVAADGCDGLLFGTNRRRLGRHARHIIAHRPICEIVDPRETLHEESRPRRGWTRTLAEKIHRAVTGELACFSRRYVQRVGDLLQVAISRLCSETDKRRQ